MGNDCSLLSDCADSITGKHSQRVLVEEPLHYDEKTKTAELKKMPLRKREQSYSEPILDSFDAQKLPPQQTVIGVPQEFLKLYEFGTMLGIGTTSKVYQIYHTRRKYFNGHRKPFACKIIDKGKLTLGMMEEDVDPLVQQLRKEVDILRRINHPHIVAFQDFVETKRLLFIITEYLPGGELFDYILKYGPLSETLACTALYGIFSAVTYLHDRGVIHRDIKAENVIFFQKMNGDISLKLIDFGFSTILKHDLTGSFLGTGGYIAPEIRQNKQYSTSVDNWALGVLLYCTLSAKLPFSISLEALPSERSACNALFLLRFPSKQWANVSETCKQLIRQLLFVDPLHRLAAKEACLHPWFRPARLQRKLQLQEQQNQTVKSNSSSSHHHHHHHQHQHRRNPSMSTVATNASSNASTPRSFFEGDDGQEFDGNSLNNNTHNDNHKDGRRYYQVENQYSDNENDDNSNSNSNNKSNNDNSNNNNMDNDGKTESEGSETGSGSKKHHQMTADTDGSECFDAMNGRNKPLQKLQSALRPVQSLIQLERKHNRHHHHHHENTSNTNNPDENHHQQYHAKHRPNRRYSHDYSHDFSAYSKDDKHTYHTKNSNNNNHNKIKKTKKQKHHELKESQIENSSTHKEERDDTANNSKMLPFMALNLTLATASTARAHDGRDDNHGNTTADSRNDDSSSNVETPRGIIHSKPVQDHNKLPSIRIHHNNNHHNDHNSDLDSSDYHSANENKGNNKTLAAGHLSTNDLATMTLLRIPLHNSANSNTNNNLNNNIHSNNNSNHNSNNNSVNYDVSFGDFSVTTASFFSEEIHDKYAGCLFYYTYIPLNSALR